MTDYQSGVLQLNKSFKEKYQVELMILKKRWDCKLSNHNWLFEKQ